MEYMIVERDTIRQMEIDIDTYLKEGWALQGGVCIYAIVQYDRMGHTDGYSTYYCQAITRTIVKTEAEKAQ